MAQFVGGRYQLIAQLGGGGMADVYLAKLTGKSGFAKLAVVKRLKTAEDDDPEVSRMFADEARLCARLNHPGIVQTFEVGEDTTGPFLVMEYIEGQPLGRIRSRATRRKSAVPRNIALKILRDTVAALAYAHELVDHDGTPLALVHRDVSPENIMVTYAGLTKLVDFGVAKTAASLSQTRAGVLKGKVAYMAPEQARSDVNIDERADLFAVGLILWETLTARRLWDGLSEAKVFERLLDPVPLPRPREIDPDIEEDFDEICARAMAKDKEARYRTANDLLDALEAASAKHNLHASDREIGQYVSKLFEAERTRVRELVSGAMGKKDAAAPGTSGISGIPKTASLDPNSPSHPDRQDPVLAKALDEGLGSPNLPLSPPAPTYSSSPSRTQTNLVEPTRVEPPPRQSTTIQTALVAAAGIILLGGVAAFVGTQLGASPDPATLNADKPLTNRVAEVTSPQPTASTTKIRPDVSIDITVRPASARVTVDGAPVSNPYRLKITKDETPHEVRAEAEGYEARVLTLAWDRDRSLDLGLTRTSPEPITIAPPTIITRPAPGPRPPTVKTASTTVAAPSARINEMDPGKPKSGGADKIDTDVFKR